MVDICSDATCDVQVEAKYYNNRFMLRIRFRFKVRATATATATATASIFGSTRCSLVLTPPKQGWVRVTVTVTVTVTVNIVTVNVAVTRGW